MASVIGFGSSYPNNQSQIFYSGSMDVNQLDAMQKAMESTWANSVNASTVYRSGFRPYQQTGTFYLPSAPPYTNQQTYYPNPNNPPIYPYNHISTVQPSVPIMQPAPTTVPLLQTPNVSIQTTPSASLQDGGRTVTKSIKMPPRAQSNGRTNQGYFSQTRRNH